MTALRPDEQRCPICGDGVFVDVAYRDPTASESVEDRQSGDSVEILTFSCGHEARGPALAVADPHRLTVETRTTEETVDRTPVEGGGAP